MCGPLPPQPCMPVCILLGHMQLRNAVHKTAQNITPLLCTFLHLLVTTFFLGTNSLPSLLDIHILLYTIFSDILNHVLRVRG